MPASFRPLRRCGWRSPANWFHRCEATATHVLLVELVHTAGFGTYSADMCHEHAVERVECDLADGYSVLMAPLAAWHTHRRLRHERVVS